MHVEFTIPEWVLWAAGGIALLPLIFLAVVGFFIMVSFSRVGPFR